MLDELIMDRIIPAADLTSVSHIELLQALPVHLRPRVLVVVVRVLEVVVRGDVQLPVVELQAVYGRLLAGLGEGHEVLHLLTLRRL